MEKEHYFNFILGAKMFKLLTHHFLSKSQVVLYYVFVPNKRKGGLWENDGDTVYIMLEETFPLIFLLLSPHSQIILKKPNLSLVKTFPKVTRVRRPTFWKVVLKLFLTQIVQRTSNVTLKTKCYSMETSIET